MNAPHLVLIVLDTQRRDRLSLYGHTVNTSPALDDYAARATVFTRAIAPAQWTIPAHGSLFTGFYPTAHGFSQAFDVLSETHVTLAELLQLAGYRTAAFCNNPLVGVLDNGLQRGFAEFYNYAGASPNRPRTRPATLLTHAYAAFNRFARAVSNRFAHSAFLFELGLQAWFTPLWTRFANYKGSTARSIADLCAYWETHTQRGDTPLFVYLNLMGTHMPLRPAAATLRRIAPDIAKSRAALRWMAQHNGDGASWISPLRAPLADWQRETVLAHYDASIVEQDAHLARYLALLARTPNTRVIVTADHGEGLGDHNHFGHSFVVHHELVHVPLLVRDEEQFTGGQHTANVSTRRVFHTLLAWAGQPAPASHDADALPLGIDTPAPAFSEAVPPQTLLTLLHKRAPDLVARLALTQTRRAIYDGDYKLLICGEQLEALYNVAQDSTETQDLAPTPDAAAHVRPLAAKLAAFVQAQHAAAAPTTMPATYGEEVLANLRALGYLE